MRFGLNVIPQWDLQRWTTGLVGLTNAGKTVLLTSLVNHLLHHDPVRLPVNDRHGRAIDLAHLPFEAWPAVPERLARPFDYEAARNDLAEARWPAKTLEVQAYRCGVSARVGDQRAKRVQLELIDIPGERFADVPMMTASSYAVWSDTVIGELRRFNFARQAAAPFLELVDRGGTAGPDPAELLRAYKLTLGLMVESCIPTVSPSAFLVDPQGRYVPENIPASVTGRDFAEAMADRAVLGLDAQRQFAPMPRPMRESAPSVAEAFERHWQTYRHRYVEPFARSLQRCQQLVVVVDVAMLLQGGPDMKNANDQLIAQIVRHVDPGLRSWADAADRVLATLPVVGERLRLPGVRRLAFVAAKADRVYPSEHPALRSLLESMARPHVRGLEHTRRQLGIDFFEVAAVNGTRAVEAGGQRYLTYEDAGGVRRRVPAIELPRRGWPGSWDPTVYQRAIPDVPRPRLPATLSVPPDHLGMERLVQFVLGL